ncbi:hypothetical protein VP01_134g14, partial [Puccinia sorghi]
DLTPLDYSQTSHTKEKITRIQASLQTMTPFEREKHLDSIEWILEGFFHNLENMAAQIWVDKNKPCVISHWMSMPTTGNLLVELYNRPVFYFSAWSQYFFPSSTGPNNNPPIFLALTSTPHFIALKMEDETLSPAPQYGKN